MIRIVVVALLESWRRGLLLPLTAPLAVLLVIAPEFAQHVVEIGIGLFDSDDAARRLHGDLTRMAFGAVKLTGLLLAFIACTRAVWVHRHGGTWWRPSEIAWGPLLLGVIGFIAVPSLLAPFEAAMPTIPYQAIVWSVTIATLPFLLILIGGLCGRRVRVADAYRRGWPDALVTALLVVLAFAPPMLLHGALNRAAIGQPTTLVWAMLTVDSLVVGWIAALTGSALAVGFDRFAARIPAVPT